MRTVILAGGLGTRLAEETSSQPKPMVTIGGHPMLWHILKIYSYWGHEDFVVTLGYKANVIKEYLLNLRHFSSSFEIRTASQRVEHIGSAPEEHWSIAALDTGEHTQTGGRIKRAMDYVGRESVMVTYGDGVADVNIGSLLDFHRGHGKLCTITAVRPPARFGRLELDGDSVQRFGEKLQSQEGWINGGFMVLEPEVAQLIESDSTAFEDGPLTALAEAGELKAFRHDGFWQPMDTLRERMELESLWQSGEAPWKVWD